MNSHFSPTENDLAHLLHDRQESDHVRRLMVSPAEVDKLNPLRVKLVGIVRQSELLVDSVPALGMLSRLLQVDNRAHVVSLELLHQPELRNQSRRRPLHSQHVSVDPTGVQSLDRVSVSLVALVVLVGAELPSAERAEKSKPFLERHHASFYLTVSSPGLESDSR